MFVDKINICLFFVIGQCECTIIYRERFCDSLKSSCFKNFIVFLFENWQKYFKHLKKYIDTRISRGKIRC